MEMERERVWECERKRRRGGRRGEGRKKENWRKSKGASVREREPQIERDSETAERRASE